MEMSTPQAAGSEGGQHGVRATDANSAWTGFAEQDSSPHVIPVGSDAHVGGFASQRSRARTVIALPAAIVRSTAIGNACLAQAKLPRAAF